MISRQTATFLHRGRFFQRFALLISVQTRCCVLCTCFLSGSSSWSPDLGSTHPCKVSMCRTLLPLFIIFTCCILTTMSAGELEQVAQNKGNRDKHMQQLTYQTAAPFTLSFSRFCLFFRGLDMEVLYGLLSVAVAITRIAVALSCLGLTFTACQQDKHAANCCALKMMALQGRNFFLLLL